MTASIIPGGASTILLATILLATGPAAAGEEPRVVATYRRGVTEAELESWLGFTDSRGEDRELAVRGMVLSRALAEEALRLGLDREPLIRLELERKDAAQVRALLHRHGDGSIRFTDEEVEAKVRSGQGTFGLPRRVRLRNLFKRYPPDAGDEEKAAVRARMEELRRRLVGGADLPRRRRRSRIPRPASRAACWATSVSAPCGQTWRPWPWPWRPERSARSSPVPTG